MTSLNMAPRVVASGKSVTVRVAQKPFAGSVSSLKAKVSLTTSRKVVSVRAGPIGDTTGLSEQQIEFLKRRAGLIPDPHAGPNESKAMRPAGAPAAAPAAAAASTPAAATGQYAGFSQEQIEFLQRKRGEIPDPLAGPNESKALRVGAPAPAPVAAAPAYSAPAPAAAPAAGKYAGLSQEQIEFLQRKNGEIPDPLAGPNESKALRVGAPAPVAAAAPAAAPAPPAAGQFSAEQLEFLNRKKAEQLETLLPKASSAAPAAPVATAGLSPEQIAFLERKKAGVC
jgi:hypothetical protein